MSNKPVDLATLLSIVPYFHTRGTVRLDQAAADLQLTEKKLRAELQRLWMCGLPGHGGGDLIDLEFATEELEDAEAVAVTFTAGLDRPVRLSPSEAITLETALAVLAEFPEVANPAELAELRETLRRASAQSGAGPSADGDAPASVGDVVRDALDRGEALEFVYHSATSDRQATRVVDPAEIVLRDGHSYLSAVDRESGQWRTFRTDRIRDAVPVGPKRETGPVPDHGGGELHHTSATVPRSAAWFLDEFPFASVTETDDGDFSVEIGYYTVEWLERFMLGHAHLVIPDDPDLRATVADTAARALEELGE